MKQLKFILPFFFVHCLLSCKTKTSQHLEPSTQEQLTAINDLLRSDSFSLLIARAQDTAYYKGIGEPVPPFLTAAQDTAFFMQPVAEHKAAISLAGFYALECGIGLLCHQTKETPAQWLQKIVDDKADSGSVLLLNRFANATWKAGQPFRGLDRIHRPSFTIASMLSPNEIEKDHYQVKTAASKLLASLQAVKDSSLNTQMQRIRTLLHSQSYAYEMAAFMSAGHPAGEQQEESGPQPVKDSGFVKTTARDQKIATNLAGFYALECALNYVVSTKNLSPKTILQSITSNSIDEEDKALFSRFANATWKASQPFRGLARIERETFAPFYFLNEADIEKDWVQIKSAAATVLQALPQ